MTTPRTGQIHANLVLAANGATSLSGRSAPLSSGADRELFHALRSIADLIVIGGETARVEPYEKTPCELVVLTRSDDLGRAALNPRARAEAHSITDFLESYHDEDLTILIEAGATLLNEAIAAKGIALIHITRTPRDGDGGFIDIALFEKNYELIDEELCDDERFQLWQLRATD